MDTMELTHHTGGEFMTLDIDFVRSQFPALERDGIYFDNPGGSQVVRHSLDRIQDYLVNTNSNRGGAFSTSQASDAIIDQSRAAVASFINADRPEEIVFGPNMTSLTLSLSRSITGEFSASDEIIVTRLDHDANISPWLHVAAATGCQLHWIDFDRASGRLSMDQLESALNERTKLVAVGYASNALGTINPIAQICEMARSVGAWSYVDAVQYAPHQPIDVAALGCDFLVASAYKLFGPHLGFLYGRYELLDLLKAFKVRPAPENPPGKFETGTQNHEGIAGLLGVMEYLGQLGRRLGDDLRLELEPTYQGVELDLKAAMGAIMDYEHDLCGYLLNQLRELPEVQIYGPMDLDNRVPTVSFRLEGIKPGRAAQLLGDLGVYVWNGNFYALAVTEHLGLEDSGGLIRVGLVHYNQRNEIDSLINGLKTILAGK